MKRFGLTTVCLLAVLATGWAESFSGVVYDVFDGDTIKVRKLNRQHVIVHLVNVKSPGLKQEYGKEAQRFLEISALKQMVRVFVKKENKDGSYTALVLLDNGTNLTQELIRTGMARLDDTGSADKFLAKLQDKARTDKLGLWQAEVASTSLNDSIK